MKKAILVTIILAIPVFAFAAPDDDLLQAARSGSARGIQSALLAGASIDALQHPDEKNVFMLASSVDALEQLLSAPSFLKFHDQPLQCLGVNNINRPDRNGMTALAYAIENNDLRKVQALVKHGVRLEGQLRLTTPIQFGGNNYNNISIYKFAGLMALERNGSIPNSQEEANAIASADSIYRYLIAARNGRRIKQQEYFDAIDNNDLNGVKDALAPQGDANVYGGADVNGLTDEGESHLALAFQHGGHQTLLNWLLHDVYQYMCENNMVPQFTRVNIQSANGRTTLQAAIEDGNENAVKSLLAAQASLTNLYNNKTLPQFAEETQPSNTPIGALIARSIANAYLFYLVQNGTVAAINNVLDGNPFTMGGANNISYRCAMQAEVNGRTQQDGLTPAMFAAVGGEVEKLQALIAKGADITPAMRSDNGDTTLMKAALYGQNNTITLILSSGNYRPEDVNARNDLGQTALMLAAQYGALPAIQTLLDAGADKSITDNNGHNALWYLDNGTYAAKMYQYELDASESWQQIPAAQAANKKAIIVNALTP